MFCKWYSWINSVNQCLHPKLTLCTEIWHQVFPFKRTHCLFPFHASKLSNLPMFTFLHLPADSVIDFQIIFMLNRWSSILISTCLLFSVKFFNTDVLTIRKTLDNSLVSACKMIWGFLFLPQGQEGTRARARANQFNNNVKRSYVVLSIIFSVVWRENASANISLVGTTLLCALDRIS